MDGNLRMTPAGSILESRIFDGFSIDRVQYRSAGYRIIGWVMRPGGAGPFPVVVYNHGSRTGPDGSVDLARPTISLSTPAWPGVAAARCLVFFPEGRGYAGSEGPKLTDCGSGTEVMAYLQGRAADVSAGLAWLGGQAWADTGRVALTGCSHGAAVSLLAAPWGAYGAIVLQAPGLSAAEPSLGMALLAEAISGCTAPVHFQHAVDDLLSPITLSRDLVAAGRRQGRAVTLTEFPTQPGHSGHAQFDFANRALWAADFDRALQPIVGHQGPVVGMGDD